MKPIVEYEKIAPNGAKPAVALEEIAEPDTAWLLDEVAQFIRQHLHADGNTIRALTLFAAATHAMPEAFVTFPHLAFRSRKPGLDGMNSGKTTAMNVTAALCPSPHDAKGTYAALRSKLRAAKDTAWTFTYDKVDSVYGLDGMNRGGNPVLTMFLEEGYKKGPTDSVSRQGVEIEYPLFQPILMTMNATGLPQDIMGRCVQLFMEAGAPERYFSVRESGADAKALSGALGLAVRSHIADISEFRARGIHPKLTQRLLEVWEPLFAVAAALGGQRWLNWCLEVFAALGVNAEQHALSPAQQVLRDMAALLEQVQFTLPSGKLAAEGIVLAEEMKRAHPENDIYSTKTTYGVATAISQAMPSRPRQVRIGKERVNVYYADDILRAWDAVRPADLADATVAEEENPFAVTAVSDDEFDEVFEEKPQPASQKSVKVVSASGKKL